MRLGFRACCVVVLLLILVGPLHAACINIFNAADFDKIRNNLAATYCLKADIDLGSIANFKMLGDVDQGFKGTLIGNGHTVRNLHIKSSSNNVALFPSAIEATFQDITFDNATVVGTGGGRVAGLVAWARYITIKNVRFVGSVQCKNCNAMSRVGGLVATFSGVPKGLIDQSSTAGLVACDTCWAGGVLGQGSVTITRSWSAATVKVKSGKAGGLAASIDHGASFITFSQNFASGDVICSDGCIAGGLLAENIGQKLEQVYALGSVRVGAQGRAGGLVGNGSGRFTSVYATGTVSGGDNSTLGGLVGEGFSNEVDDGYTTGRVLGGPGSSVGAIFGGGGASSGSGETYWDSDTSGLTSDNASGSAARTTADLQGALPGTFVGPRWAITKTLSYPYLNGNLAVLSNSTLSFASPLATLVFENKLFIFMPIRQLETFEYANTPSHADEASKAAAYTMIARAIGAAERPSLKAAKIDTYWDDDAKTANWSGAVTDYAELGPIKPIGSATVLDDSNVIGALKDQNVVLLRGNYAKKTGGTGTSWMLATLFTTDSDDMPFRVIANDPYTGQQVQINLMTKRVVSPSGFALSKFTVDRYQIVSLK